MTDSRVIISAVFGNRDGPKGVSFCQSTIDIFKLVIDDLCAALTDDKEKGGL